MGLERAPKQPAAGSARGHDHEHDHDPGMLHAAQLERERRSRAHAKPAADSASAEAMNDALLLVAHDLRGAFIKAQTSLKNGGFQVSIYNQNIEDERVALDDAEQQYDRQLAKSNPSRQATHRLTREMEEHGDNLKNTREAKKDHIAGLRDRVFEPLVSEPVRKLQDIAAEAQVFGWSGDQHVKVANGVNYLRTMVKQIHDLGKALELDSSPSLKAVEKALDDIVQAIKLSLADADPEDLEAIDPYILTQKSVSDNLIAAEAQARNAQAAIRAWAGHSKTADFAHVVGSVQAVEFHLRDATRLLGELKPADRHQFRGMLHGLVKEVEAVYHLGRIHADGHAPAGSESMTVESFPHFLGELRKAIG